MVAGRLGRLARFDALAAVAVLWFLGKFVRYALPPLFGTIDETYGVSRAALGGVFTAFMLVYALTQFPSGLLADRFGSVRVLAAGALVAAAGALALVVDSPFLVLVGAVALMGLGTGTYKTVSVELLARAYPARRGRTLGIFDTFGTFGGVAAPAVVVAVTALPPVLGAPWRTLFLLAGVATVGLAGVVVARVPPRLSGPDAAPAVTDGDDASDGSSTANPDGSSAADQGDRPDPGSLRTYLDLFRDVRFSAFVAVTVCFGFAYNGAVAFLPLYLTSETALSAATANLLFSALFVVSLVQLVSGEASDRAGALPVLAASLGVATAGFAAVLALSSTGGPLTLGAAVVALGLGSHGFRPVRGAYLMAILPDDVAGGGLGAVRTLLMGAGAVGPAVVGYVSEAVGFRPAFGLLAAALAAALALTLVLWALER
ncbi:MFS transporter [Halomicrobium salinisoli]|uniref:MFS transporter n=1 Tax=Halomicrobium salinisoli TaxID=2878391 RepID=UPI001CF08973|nr:MFS transporter [Halomicrobium salinisoli]